MSDRDEVGGAWRISPTQYLQRRPPTHSVPQPRSSYVTMRDGIRLAVDVYVPAVIDAHAADPGRRFPPSSS